MPRPASRSPPSAKTAASICAKILGAIRQSQSIYLTSPAVIYKDLMIVGGRESETLPASPGDVRAYDVRTGKLRWSFHTIPHPGEFGYDTWPKDAWKTSGAANNWTGMTVDTQRGIVYVPTGSAAFDFYGADRDRRRSVRQLPDRPERRDRRAHLAFSGSEARYVGPRFPRPACASDSDNATARRSTRSRRPRKQGFVFLFDRANGKPLFPIECRNYPASDVPGEVAAASNACLPSPRPLRDNC